VLCIALDHSLPAAVLHWATKGYVRGVLISHEDHERVTVFAQYLQRKLADNTVQPPADGASLEDVKVRTISFNKPISS
jgi:hypothetical protein